MTTTAPTGTELLAVPLPENDAGAATVRDYLVALVSVLWREEEDFSSKRPFGNSGWSYEVYAGLADAGLIEATRGGDGFLYDLDVAAADVLVQKAIAALGDVA